MVEGEARLVAVKRVSGRWCTQTCEGRILWLKNLKRTSFIIIVIFLHVYKLNSRVLPERKGLLCILLGGLGGIRVSKFTSEAPVGPRKASGVRHTRVAGALSGGASRDRSNISGLDDSRPFTRGLPGGSGPNGSCLGSRPENRSDSGFVPNNSASIQDRKHLFTFRV